MIAGIVTVFYVLGIAAAVEAIMTVRTPQGAIAWSVSLVSMPFIALPAYLVFGRSKFEGVVEAYEQSKDEIDTVVSDIRENLQPWAASEDERHWTYAAIPKLSGMNLTRGNRVELLINGEATFDSIIAGISEAKEYVLVQFYMFHDDGLGRRMQQSLIEGAKVGLRVYMLYDEVGSKGLPASYVDELRAAGVEVTSFKPTRGVRNQFQLNFRNHRKMVVVDGITGWVGGHNVGDEYLGLDADLSPWRDTHVRRPLQPTGGRLRAPGGCGSLGTAGSALDRRLHAVAEVDGVKEIPRQGGAEGPISVRRLCRGQKLRHPLEGAANIIDAVGVRESQITFAVGAEAGSGDGGDADILQQP